MSWRGQAQHCVATALLFFLGSTAAFAETPPICADRPSKANGSCTVPAGRIQIETNAADWSLTKADGNRTEAWTLGSTYLKYGLDSHSDLELGLTPYAEVTTKAGGERSRASGFGDVLIKYKRRLTAADADLQAGLIPFIKLPTAAKGLGNDKAEGGLAVPLSFPVGPVTATLGPELDLLADSDGSGYHAAIVNLLNLGGTVAPRLSVSAELWNSLNLDPDGTITQVSADASLAYLVTNDIQVDAGVNAGLTRDTPDIELYFGVSIRP